MLNVVSNCGVAIAGIPISTKFPMLFEAWMARSEMAEKVIKDWPSTIGSKTLYS
jgi:hypothetical protein